MDVTETAIASIAESPYAKLSTWSIGLDIGQSNDPTAFAAVESVQWCMSRAFEAKFRHKSGAWVRMPEVSDIVAQKPSDELHIRALKRLPLGTSYPAQCKMIVALLADPRLASAAVYLDRTGVGRAVSDLFRTEGVKHTAVIFTNGREEGKQDGDNITVPKLHLISRLQSALHSGELKVAKSLVEAGAFVRELQEFRGSFTAAGSLQLNARQGAHDDYISAVSLAIYGLTRPRMAMGRLGIRMWPP